MPDCVVCGDPVFIHVDDRPLCAHHGWVVLRELERLIDHLKRNQVPAIAARFATIEDYVTDSMRASKRYGR